MKKLIALWAICIIVFSISSCSDSDDNSADNYTKQTILVYMPWSGSATSNGLYSFFQQNLDSIEAGIIANKGLNGCRVLVFLSNTASSSNLYEINYDNGKCTHTPIKEYSGNTVYTTADGIKQIVSETAQYASALNYAMIIGCHGTGWTQKDIWENYPNYAKKFQFYNQPTTLYMKTRFYGSVDDIANYATDVSTLAQGIADTGIKMQYILFDDCYMANAETAYELRNATNFLIASTSEVIVIGMPYKSMWSSLCAGVPNYTTAVSQFNNFYKNYTVPCGALSVIDCRQMESLADAMKKINAKNTFDESLRDSLQVLDGFHSTIFYDMGDYVKRLDGKSAQYSTFTTALSKTIRATATTERLYSYLYNTPIYINVKNYSGITISDPTQNTTALKGVQKTSWWKATHE